MNIEIRWFAGKEYKQIEFMIKTWDFTTEDFNGEIPRVGDKISLLLPIQKESQSKIEKTSWTFEITERTWHPEGKEKSIALNVELVNPKSFWALSDEVKAELKETIDEERASKREQWLASLKKEIIIPDNWLEQPE